MKASSVGLEALLGRYVRAATEFSGVPAGTIGFVDEVYGDPPAGVMVRWERPDDVRIGRKPLRDGFGRGRGPDPDLDETKWLDVLETPICSSCLLMGVGEVAGRTLEERLAASPDAVVVRRIVAWMTPAQKWSGWCDPCFEEAIAILGFLSERPEKGATKEEVDDFLERREGVRRATGGEGA